MTKLFKTFYIYSLHGKVIESIVINQSFVIKLIKSMVYKKSFVMFV